MGPLCLFNRRNALFSPVSWAGEKKGRRKSLTVLCNSAAATGVTLRHDAAAPDVGATGRGGGSAMPRRGGKFGFLRDFSGLVGGVPGKVVCLAACCGVVRLWTGF